MSTSAWGIEHGEVIHKGPYPGGQWGPNADQKSKRHAQNRAIGAVGAGGLGGALIGIKGLRSHAGKAGAGLAAAGLGTQLVGAKKDIKRGVIKNPYVSKGWGGDTAARAGAKATKAVMKKPKTPKSDPKQEHYHRAWRKFTNLQERSNAGAKISPMRSRAFAPLEHQLPAYGGRTGSSWEFNGNKRVRKAL